MFSFVLLRQINGKSIQIKSRKEVKYERRKRREEGGRGREQGGRLTFALNCAGAVERV